MIVKNLKPENLVSFKNDGSVLIGSFNKYRKDEGPGRDETEGIKGVDIKTNEPITIKGDDLGKLVSYVKVKGPFNINVHGSLIVKNAVLLSDAYTFCTSLKVIPKFGGAHYNIIKISDFGEEIFTSLREKDNQVFAWTHGRVSYGGSKDQITTARQLKELGNFNINEFNVDDCFCKPEKYVEEEEYRFVFLTRARPIPEKLLIKNKHLIKCCSFD